MGDIGDRRRKGRAGTDLPSILAVQDAVTRKIRRQWAGWSLADREDLQQLVMSKYVAKFGRDRLPDDAEGLPAVPHAWLNVVVRNAGVDFHRQVEARPADPVDFQGTGSYGLDLLMRELSPAMSLSSEVARNVDAERLLTPALNQLAQTHPADVQLLIWRYDEDRDLTSIATELGKSADAVKIAIRRALSRLRHLLE